MNDPIDYIFQWVKLDTKEYILWKSLYINFEQKEN